MHACDDYALQLVLYRDGELDGDERQAVDAHLKTCAVCRASLAREQRFLRGVQRSAPLYRAPQALQERVQRTVRAGCGEHVRVRRFAAEPCAKRSWRARMRRAGRRHLSAVLLTLLSVSAGVWGVGMLLQMGPSVSLAAMAVDAHQRHGRSQLPLEISSHDASEISRWFKGKVGFEFHLPNYQDVSGQDKRYSLQGGRLVGFNGDYAAYVSYQMEEHPISLLVTSRQLAAPSGRHMISSKGIDFHYDTLAGLKVITWSHRDLTYALVSDLDERGQDSCLVCHQGASERDFINGMAMLVGAGVRRFGW